MDDKELLSAAIAASGKSMRAFRADVLDGYPKNVRNVQRWLEGAHPLPIAVRERCVAYLTEQLASIEAAAASAPRTTLSLAEAELESGISASTLRVQLNKGRLAGEKRGGAWFIDADELERYLASRSPRGRRSTKELNARTP